MNALEMQGLTKRYGKKCAVDGIDLQLASGESLAVIGHNGAGKTTLLKLILGLTRPSCGVINHRAWSGVDAQSAPVDQSIGFLPESVYFSGTLTGRHALRFYARLKRASNIECEELLDLVGLSDAAGHKINTYSKGMRQRLGLAQALLGYPELLLLDEPTSGLDPFLRQHFYDIIGERQSAGASVIISSHALTEIEARTDRIAIMKHGQILEVGSLSVLRQKAALPIQVSVRAQPGMALELQSLVSQPFALYSTGEHNFQFSCTQKQKLAVLQRLTSRPDIVADVSMRPPGLDDLYTFFVNGGSQ